jgi:hypothetical protein
MVRTSTVRFILWIVLALALCCVGALYIVVTHH